MLIKFVCHPNQNIQLKHHLKMKTPKDHNKRQRWAKIHTRTFHYSQSSVPGLKKIQQFKDTMGRFHMTAVYSYRTVLSWLLTQINGMRSKHPAQRWAMITPLRGCLDFCVPYWVSPGLDTEDTEGLQTPATGGTAQGLLFFLAERGDFYKAQ